MCQSNSFITVPFYFESIYFFLGLKQYEPVPWVRNSTATISMTHMQRSSYNIPEPFIATICNNIDPNRCNQTTPSVATVSRPYTFCCLFCSGCHLLRGFGRDGSGRVMNFVGGIRLGGGWPWLQWLLAKVVVRQWEYDGSFIYLF